MNHRLALRVIGQVMGWDDARCFEELNWLQTISRYRYDGYRGFVAGARFVESLVYWLQQFDQEDRELAYQFVRNKLVYISSAQTENLVRSFQAEFVQTRLMQAVSEELKIPNYMVWATEGAAERYRALLRQTLFFGLSDGARMDVFRRANSGVISNEQVVVGTEINEEKWESVLKNLREDSDPDNKFRFVFLVDDFTASGTTLLRKVDGRWKGKLFKFFDQHHQLFADHLDDSWVLCVHHHIATDQAKQTLAERIELAGSEIEGWNSNLEMTYGTTLTDQCRTMESDSQIVELINKYYNPGIETSHNAAGGTDDIRFGYSNCRLNLVLEHNTPNNSLPIIWATHPASGEHREMRPLFDRRQRHV